jgi:hypothetical protein
MRVTRSILAVALMVGLTAPGSAEARKQQSTPKGPYRNPSNNSLESLDDKKNDPEGPARYLASGDEEDDITHYHNLSRRLGIDVGVLVPFGDFQKGFASAAMIGLHLSWEAIPPFGFVVSMDRASAPQKDSANSNGKLTVSSINLGAQASFPYKRFVPFAKLEGAFHFNSVNFNDGRRILSGDDLNLTTVGLNAGLGIDFVVGREVSIGLDITYHYSVPKKLSISDGTTFDLGAPYVTTGFRVNF